jgi:hypothetical protein
MRQRFANDFTKFDAARPLSKESLGIGNQMYGDITDAIHRGVPESASLDRRISNLIPAAESGDARDLEPGLGSSILKRAAARTGALAAGAGLGYAYGSPILGTAMGAVVPEMLSNPTVQMIGARGLNAGGKALRSPLVTRPVQVSPFIRPQPQTGQ